MMLYTSLQRDPPKKYQPFKGCKERQYFPSIAQFYCLQGHAIPTRGFFKFYNPPDQTVKWLLSVRKTPLCSRVAPSSFFFIPFLEIVRIVDCSFPLDIKKKKEKNAQGVGDSSTR